MGTSTCSQVGENCGDPGDLVTVSPEAVASLVGLSPSPGDPVFSPGGQCGGGRDPVLGQVAPLCSHGTAPEGVQGWWGIREGTFEQCRENGLSCPVCSHSLYVLIVSNFFKKRRKKIRSHESPGVSPGPVWALSGVLYPALCVLGFSNIMSIKITLKIYRLFFSEPDLQTGQNTK